MEHFLQATSYSGPECCSVWHWVHSYRGQSGGHLPSQLLVSLLSNKASSEHTHAICTSQSGCRVQ